MLKDGVIFDIFVGVPGVGPTNVKHGSRVLCKVEGKA